MSRCTPNISGWGTRAKRYGGRAAIASIRARQFQQLAAMAGDPNGPPTTKTEVTAREDIAFLEVSPVRILSVNTEIVHGLRPEPERSSR